MKFPSLSSIRWYVAAEVCNQCRALGLEADWLDVFATYQDGVIRVRVVEVGCQIGEIFAAVFPIDCADSDDLAGSFRAAIAAEADVAEPREVA